MYQVGILNPGNALVSVRTDKPGLQAALDHAISLTREGFKVEISHPASEKTLYILSPDYHGGLTTANVVIRTVTS